MRAVRCYVSKIHFAKRKFLFRMLSCVATCVAFHVGFVRKVQYYVNISFISAINFIFLRAKARKQSVTFRAVLSFSGSSFN